MRRVADELGKNAVHFNRQRGKAERDNVRLKDALEEFGTPEELARRFHDTYERLAPEYGYTTREDTKEFDPDSPNGKLMIAVCATLKGSER